MPIDWNAITKALSPIKNYEDLSQRLQTSFQYPFVREAYNFSMPELASYTGQLLGGDSRGRYTSYLTLLKGIFAGLYQAGVLNPQDLIAKVATRDQLEAFAGHRGVDASDIASVLKYLIYWVIPMEKYLSGLVRDDPVTSSAIKALSRIGIRTNLGLLQSGITAVGRRALAKSSLLAEPILLALVNRADFSRLPWASKATISNIIGAGYGSLAQLAGASQEQVTADFLRYGESIVKNLKIGNEIENSYRIAKIIPAILQED